MIFDTSIYKTAKPLNIMGNAMAGYQDAMGIKELKYRDAQRKQEAARQKALKDAFANNTSIGPDGKMMINNDAVMADLYKNVGPQEAMAVQKTFRENRKGDLEDQVLKLNATSRLLGQANDLESYKLVRESLIQQGLMEPTTLPEMKEFDRKFVDNLRMQLIPYEEQLRHIRGLESAKNRGMNPFELGRFQMAMDANMRAAKAQEMQFAREARAERRQDREDRKQKELTFVPGLGYADSAVNANKMKQGLIQKAKFDRQLGEMINLREKYGYEAVNRDAVARGKQLSKDLLLTYKNLAKLGVLSQSDEEIINAIIPKDPLGFGGAWGDSIMTQLKGLKRDVDNDFQMQIQSYIREPLENMKTDFAPAAPRQRAPKKDASKMSREEMEKELGL